MMVQTRKMRQREVRGPQPHSVAIFARTKSNRPPDTLILENRKEEEGRMEAIKNAKMQAMSDLRNDWVKQTDKRIVYNRVKRKVNDLMTAHQHSIEDRRERLRALLAEDERCYLEETEAKEETTLERQAKMRQRAKQLKEERESERIAIVQQKLDQQWRNQCEELRATLSKRRQDHTTAELMEQMRVKACIEEQRQEEEKMYADMWYADMAAKAQREEDDARKANSANREMMEVLHKQMAALEAQKDQEKRLVEEEAELLKEQLELRKLEEERARAAKVQKQAETRDLLDRSLQLKRQKEAKELQEQLAFDMKMLEQLIEESKNEAMEMAQKKRERLLENQRYMAYLKTFKEEDARREAELEKICDAEVEKSWQKKLAQWRLEKQARERLLQEVLEGRRAQIEEKLRINGTKLQEAQRERENIIRKLEENQRLEKEEIEKIHMQNKKHQMDLLGQIDYNRRQREQAMTEEERLNSMEMEAEREYRRKLEEALANPHLDDKLHPIRKAKQHGTTRSRTGMMNC